jgi:hypothetical protein
MGLNLDVPEKCMSGPDISAVKAAATVSRIVRSLTRAGTVRIVR